MKQHKFLGLLIASLLLPLLLLACEWPDEGNDPPTFVAPKPKAIIDTTLTNGKSISNLDVQFDVVLPEKVTYNINIGQTINYLLIEADNGTGKNGKTAKIASITWGKRGGKDTDKDDSKLTITFGSGIAPTKGKYWVVDFHDNVADAAGNKVGNVSKEGK